jgi:hypothetical protein
MFDSNDAVHMEYNALMFRARALEHTGLATWAVSTTAAVALMAWGVNAGSPGIMLSVVFAVAAGYLPLVHARQQMKLMAGYVEEFLENKAGSAQWFTKLGRLGVLPSASPSNDWIVTAASNLIVLAATVSAWLFKAHTGHGELYAGAVTACGVAFVLHSITEMTRLGQTDYAALWRKVGNGPREAERPRTSTAA